jgi:uncharacterized membrane protein YciS (DUF1049 family)
MLVLRRLVAIAIFVGALVLGWRFAAVNSVAVRVNYLLGETPELRIWVVLLCAFGFGALTSAAFLLYQVAKLSLVARRQRRLMARLEAEIHELRNLPLRSEPMAAHADDRPLAPPTGETVGPVA